MNFLNVCANKLNSIAGGSNKYEHALSSATESSQCSFDRKPHRTLTKGCSYL